MEGRGGLYLIGDKVGNGGNLAEACASEGYGYGYGFDKDCIPYDKGSDIEELKMSVKSSGASLACIYRNSNTAEDFKSIIAEYFANVHSVRWCYVVLIDNTANLYEMNAEEFKEFLMNWAGMSKESGKECYKIKFKKTSGIMVKWLEEKVEE
ncbi:MAG: hypothetical protein IKU01_01720 [Bacteroidales bacterium]|nr:hypothetical protein [Bacteroidales bacterium]